MPSSGGWTTWLDPRPASPRKQGADPFKRKRVQFAAAGVPGFCIRAGKAPKSYERAPAGAYFVVSSAVEGVDADSHAAYVARIAAQADSIRFVNGSPAFIPAASASDDPSDRVDHERDAKPAMSRDINIAHSRVVLGGATPWLFCWCVCCFAYVAALQVRV